MTELLVPRRFRGPSSSGNGGWTAGALAGLVDHDCPDNRADAWPAIRVALRRPPPLDTPMAVAVVDGSTEASIDGEVVARATLSDTDPVVVEPVPAAEARAAMATYPGLTSHPFPGCFACGTDREEGDGLRIFPGRVPDQEGATRIASVWTPHPSTAEDYHTYVDELPRASLATTWASIDCVGGWAGDLTERLMVLGRMTARVETLPVIGEEHVVVGLARGSEGRRTFTASTLYDSDGRAVASAEHVWVAIDPADFA
ncbi:MAG: hypothetical protein JWN22_317 [Nocardioides sp.]|nr:hypothetical protein [Nocardioides sp.]